MRNLLCILILLFGSSISRAIGKFAVSGKLEYAMRAALILLLCLALHGASAVLMWDANQDGGLTAGYRVYSGLASRTYDHVRDVGAQTNSALTASNFTEGATYFFAVTAYGTNGLESDYSEEVSWTATFAPEAPVTLRITGTNRIVTVQQSSDLTNWTPLVTVSATNTQSFFKTKQP